MSSKAKKWHDAIYRNDRKRVAETIADLYRIIQKQCLCVRIAFAFRVIFRRLPK